MSLPRAFLEESCRHNLPQLSHIWDMVFAADHPHYLDVSTEDRAQVAYSPNGVSATDHKRRRRLTLGRYLSRQHKVEIDSAIESGVNAVVADLMEALNPRDGSEFRILRGADITRAYVDSVGSRSCMVGENNEHITEWFSAFPERIGLLVWNDTEGRALLWLDDEGRQIVDRIYAGNSSLSVERYAAWCRDNGAQTCYNHLAGVEKVFDVSVTLGRRAVDGRPVPYLDTFRYASKDGVFCSVRQNDTAYECQSTDGDLESIHRCDCCSGAMDEDDIYTVGDETLCESCYSENYTCCDRCGEPVHNNDSVSVGNETWCTHCNENHAASCELCNDVVPADHIQVCEDTDLCPHCMDCRTSDCEQCGDRHLDSNLNDDGCCAHCAAQLVEEATSV